MRVDELNAGERQLWHSFARGGTVDVRHGPRAEDTAVRAEVVAALLLGAGAEPAPGDRPALRLTGARITGRLDLGFAEIPVPVALDACSFDEAPSLRGARVRELALTGCSLPGLAADTAQIDGRLVLSHCRLTGPLVLTRAQIHSDLDLRHTVITAPGTEAISAVHLVAGGDVLCTGLTVRGTFRCSGATIAGEFDLEGAALHHPGGHALDAYHVQVTEDLTFHPGFSSEGRIILSGATVGAAIGFCGARLSNPGDVALEAVDVTVARNFDLGRGLHVDGGITLDGSSVGTRLSFHDTTLTNPGGTALSLRLAQARETDLRTRQPIDGTVDAGGARLGTLYDAPETWPAALRLADTTYDALATSLPAAERLDWLRRGADTYLPQPYEQLAATYRRLGHEDEARTVLLAKQRHHRASLPPYTRVWGYVQDATVGYGYRPLRAGLWLAAMLACGALFFAAHPPAPLEAAKAPPFNAFVYTLDLLIPIPAFGQDLAFAPRGPAQWLAHALTAAGWILATTTAAGVTRAINRQ
ncbi:MULTISPECIES: oxidoreductase [Streptomyces]|uniref:Oxidoreductase n=1 Tax=Streptomyces griseiscabiei TaxID=2993540 RepID=A0ABU4L2V1_9ACTN|nr:MULTISPECIES: oxidoreductase [Streptomyces]MBZ3906014.1 oxidoreductase [Streptomyces griseiscabiei]MDX2909645.1 oxidoreductase [Streptomyces griseiscabiei]